MAKTLIPLLFWLAALPPAADVTFPPTLTPPGGGPVQQLTGTAVRVKTIFRIKVYAYGLYVDAAAARTALGAFAGRPVAELDRDPAFFQRLLDMRVP